MFKSLKDKLKKAVGIFSKKVDEQAEEKVIEQEVVKELPQQPEVVEEKKIEKKKKEKKSIPKKEKKVEKPTPKIKVEEKKPVIQETPSSITEEKTPVSKEKPVEPKPQKVESPVIKKPAQPKIEETKDEPITPPKQIKPQVETPKKQIEEKEEQPSKKGFFSRLTEKITTKKLSEEQFEEIFFELEITLMENNVAIEVIEKIKSDLHNALVNTQIKRSDIESIIFNELHKSLDSILTFDIPDIFTQSKKPYIITFVGVNGAGKTTTLAKFVKKILDNNKTVVVGACDTFRSAAIQQLEEHTNKLGVKLIKHNYGADAAAVAFDTVVHAKAKQLDFVLLDTAGRLHSNTNLMEELHKINKVATPDFTIFIGEAITGNDCVEQATQFNDKVGIDGIILTKADTDEKGGATVSVAYVTQKPILFLATGQTYDDLEVFDKEKILKQLFE